MGLILIVAFFVFNFYAGNLVAAAVAAVLLIVLGFMFAAVSGYLVGIIGVSSNPTSGLTVTVLIAVAFLMVVLGLSGPSGIAAVLVVAAFTCVSVSVAGEMVQDLKAGQILGCTPWRMQLGDILGVSAAALSLFLVLSVLHLGDIKGAVSAKLVALESAGVATVTYEGDDPQLDRRAYTLAEVKALAPEIQNELLATNAGFGGARIAAPQASLMAVVGRSIMERQTEWILILVGMLMGLSLILMQVKSPMLVAVGMYLPIETSFAIFVGGTIKALLERQAERRQWDKTARERAENTGTLLASGLIAGEALTGILFAALAFGEIQVPSLFGAPSYLREPGRHGGARGRPGPGPAAFGGEGDAMEELRRGRSRRPGAVGLPALRRRPGARHPGRRAARRGERQPALAGAPAHAPRPGTRPSRSVAPTSRSRKCDSWPMRTSARTTPICRRRPCSSRGGCPRRRTGWRAAGTHVTFEEVFRESQIFLAPTEYSTTAPLKVAAKRFGFRAATMPGFAPSMIPALRLDYGEVARRVDLLKERLDRAEAADVRFVVDDGRELEMTFDLRHRTAHASSGRFPERGTAGNLPSGEAYIVPYEGERGTPSTTGGLLPVQLDDEVVVFAVHANRVIDVVGDGPAAEAEREHLRREPAYGNMAELGFGVLADLRRGAGRRDPARREARPARRLRPLGALRRHRRAARLLRAVRGHPPRPHLHPGHAAAGDCRRPHAPLPRRLVRGHPQRRVLPALLIPQQNAAAGRRYSM